MEQGLDLPVEAWERRFPYESHGFRLPLRAFVAQIARSVMNWAELDEAHLCKAGIGDAADEGLVFEQGHQAGALEGALFLNGRLVGTVTGVSRL